MKLLAYCSKHEHAILYVGVDIGTSTNRHSKKDFVYINEIYAYRYAYSEKYILVLVLRISAVVARIIIYSYVHVRVCVYMRSYVENENLRQQHFEAKYEYEYG